MPGIAVLIGAIVLVVGGGFSAALWFTRPKKGRTEVVFLAAAAGFNEAETWAGSLRRAGIKTHLRNVGDSAWIASPYVYELWVKSGDEERARKVLGL